MFALDKYKLPLHAAPFGVLEAVCQGVHFTSFPPSHEAEEVLGGLKPPANGASRDADGRVLVTCVTDMPMVMPAMIDWWFAWHMPSTERYALWHPKAHIKSSAKEDRKSWPNDREKYIGNVSYVDEYIGTSLQKLAIAFVQPSTFGVRHLDERGATAICAYTSDRSLNSQGGCLIHYVVPNAGGAQMRSGFWLGDFKHHNATLNRVLRRILSSRMLRQHLVSDRIALDLLQHCGEEMNHLARFLPQLFADAHAKEVAKAG